MAKDGEIDGDLLDFFRNSDILIEYAKENLSFKTIWSFTSLTNKSSERVMQKIGMQKIKTFPHPSILDGHPLKEHVLYKLLLSNNN